MHRLIMAFIPLAVLLVRLLGLTMRIRLVDPFGVSPQAGKSVPVIYAFWHNQQLLSAFFFRGFGVRVLVSRSRDGDYIAGTLRSFGFRTVRSSTSQGKINALRGLTRELKKGYSTAITPDGPRGPIYQAQPGAIFLAAMSGCQVVPFGCAIDRVWRLRSWDAFEIPKFFSRAVFFFGKPLEISRKLDQAQTQEWTARLQNRLNEARRKAMEINRTPASPGS